VCQDYNLTIEPGECVALVGPSGSGKSTIMNLLLRFYDPIQGQVLLDGVDIKDLNVRWLRAQIGYVGQEPVLFQGSVADNIAKGRGGAEENAVLSVEDSMRQADAEHKASKTGCCGAPAKPAPAVKTHNPVADLEVGISGSELRRGEMGRLDVDEDVMQAAIQSNAHDFITEFTQGYDTDVGEGSIMVSGGQKQRIAIARALVKRPAVLLLDEATSALDAASERVVQQSIDMLQASKAQTTIVIAHRLTTIMNADRIAVIDKGRVVELGRHEELLALDGLYAQLWYKQKGTSRQTSTNNLASLAEAAAAETAARVGEQVPESSFVNSLTMGMLG
jgi:ATP-binding cassette subfamily B (MDR/TAP) protein 1